MKKKETKQEKKIREVVETLDGPSPEKELYDALKALTNRVTAKRILSLYRIVELLNNITEIRKVKV